MSVSVKEIDRGWDKIKAEVRKMDKSYVKVGILGNAQGYKDGASVQHIAAIHEYGAPERGIQKRPFMSQALKKNNESIKKFITDRTAQILGAKKTVSTALNEIGLMHQAQIRDIFTSGKFKPLKKATVERKGSSRPLIDTEHLRSSVNYEVVAK